MNTYNTLLLSIVILPIFGMEDKYDKTAIEKFVQASFERENVCETELVLKYGPHTKAYLLSCNQAKKLMNNVLQKADAPSFTVSDLKIERYQKTKTAEDIMTLEIPKEMSVKEALDQIKEFSE